jgi:hypothetical protein
MPVAIPPLLADRLLDRFLRVGQLSTDQEINGKAERAAWFFRSIRQITSIDDYSVLLNEVLLLCVRHVDALDTALGQEIWALLCVLDAYVDERQAELCDECWPPI